MMANEDARYDFRESLNKALDEILLDDWNMVKTYVIPYVVNRDRNIQRIRSMDLATYPLLDLRVLYVVDINFSKDLCIRRDVTNGMCKTWQISTEELHLQAIKNVRSSFQIEPITATIRRALDSPQAEINAESVSSYYKLLEMIKEKERTGNRQISVLQKKNGPMGAIGAFIPEVINKLADGWRSDIYILPISIHRAVLVKDTGDISPEELMNALLTHNLSLARQYPGEVLTNSMYQYSRNQKGVVSPSDFIVVE